MTVIAGSLGPKGVRDVFQAKADVARAEAERRREGWATRLAAASPQELPAVQAAVAAEKAAHTTECQKQARVRAAIITSAPGWQHPGDKVSSGGLETRQARNKDQKDGRAASRILVDAYRMVGVRARQNAALRGEVFTDKHVEEVQLTKNDVAELAKRCGMHGQGAAKRAWSLLDKHIRPDMMDSDAEKFFRASFLDFQGNMIRELGDLEERLDKQEERNKLDLGEKKQRIANYAKERDEHKKRIAKVEWSGEAVNMKRDPAEATKNIEMRVVNGRLVKVLKN